MTKIEVDSIVLRIFLALLVFDAISAVYLTPKSPVEAIVTPTVTPPPASDIPKESDHRQTEAGYDGESQDIVADDDRGGNYADDEKSYVTGAVLVQFCNTHSA